jgi:hypothetical protein
MKMPEKFPDMPWKKKPKVGGSAGDADAGKSDTDSSP